MTDTNYSPSLIRQGKNTAARATWGTSLAALLLALLLGLSAADINRQSGGAVDQAQPSAQNAPLLDGRGKWGGYM